MTREEKIIILEQARAGLQHNLAIYWEKPGTQYLENASCFANIITAMVADLD